MHARNYVIAWPIAVFLILAGCASSPEAERRQQEMEADIDEILSYELDAEEVGEPKRCLSENQYRSFRALGDRHLLFEGKDGKQWINALRGRCHGLRDDPIFIMKPASGNQSCRMEQFEVIDRMRASSISDLTTGTVCVLGEFKPVTKAQVEEIEARLESIF